MLQKPNVIISRFKLLEDTSLFSPKHPHCVTELNSAWRRSQSSTHFSINQRKKYFAKGKASAKRSEGAGSMPRRPRVNPRSLRVRRECGARRAAMLRRCFLLPCPRTKTHVSYAGCAQHVVLQTITTLEPKHEFAVAQKDGWLNLIWKQLKLQPPSPSCLCWKVVKTIKVFIISKSTYTHFLCNILGSIGAKLLKLSKEK